MYFIMLPPTSRINKKCNTRYDSNNLDTIYNLVLLVSATIPCVGNLVLFLRKDICHMKEDKLNLLGFFLMDYYKVWNYKACESGKQIYCNQAFNEYMPYEGG